MKRNLNQRLTIHLVLVTLPILLAIVAGVFHYAAKAMIVQSDARAGLAAARVEQKILTVLGSVAEFPRSIAILLGNQPPSARRLRDLLVQSLKSAPEVYGMAVAAEPYRLYPDRGAFCPYVYRQGERIRFKRLDTPTYRYLEADWYRRPKMSHSGVWSEPYFDQGGGEVLMSTFSAPIQGPDGSFKGVATADISLEHLHDLVSAAEMPAQGSAVLLSMQGKVMTHSGDGNDGIPLPVSWLQEIRSWRNEATTSSHVLTLGGREGWFAAFVYHLRHLYTGGPRQRYGPTRVILEPVGKTGWTLAVLIPLDRLYLPLYRMATVLLVAGVLGILLAVLAIMIVTRRATGDIERLAAVARKIAAGRMEAPVPMNMATEELEHLAQAFRSMQKSLNHHIHRLVDETARRERMENELRIARDIQMELLPRAFPSTGGRVDGSAVIEPALEVGGDFYDFFFVGEQKLCFVIGDVSGKGVPASLFMAMTKTLIKGTMGLGEAPGKVLERVNQALQEGNESAMFVTVFLGLLDLETGRLDYANAGHPPPMLVGAGGCEWLSSGDPLPPVGAWPEVRYPSFQREVKSDELIFSYTDGVSEATGDDNELFGTERICLVLRGWTRGTAAQAISRIRQEMKQFVGHHPQVDDITMVAVKWISTG